MRSYYSKATKRFSVGPVKEAKEYKYIWNLIEEVVNARELAEGSERLDAPSMRHLSDPRNLQATIARVPRPPMEDLIRAHKSRFLIGQ